MPLWSASKLSRGQKNKWVLSVRRRNQLAISSAKIFVQISSLRWFGARSLTPSSMSELTTGLPGGVPAAAGLPTPKRTALRYADARRGHHPGEHADRAGAGRPLPLESSNAPTPSMGSSCSRTAGSSRRQFGSLGRGLRLANDIKNLVHSHLAVAQLVMICLMMCKRRSKNPSVNRPIRLVAPE